MKTLPLLMLSLLLSACGGADVDEPRACSVLRPSALILRDRFQQPATVFSAGETVFMEWSLTNPTQQEQVFDNGGCFDAVFLVSRPGNTSSEWTSADHIACAAVVQQVRFAPGETKRYSADWNQRSSGGTQVPGGRYTASVFGPSSCRAELETAQDFFIQ